MKKWWMESFGYQIYIRSFYDSNNDGIGDLKGVTEKLDYLSDLGVNLIWLCPFYDSPMDDNGYDVRNYYDVSSDYGSIEDFKALIEKAHNLGIKVIIDLVLNHTSDENEWFINSRESLDNPYRNYYIWAKGKTLEDGRKTPPTNWPSFFGGSAWKYDEKTGEYYLKIFSDKMPDLNWEYLPLREEMAKMATWWINLGCDGFRVDATSHLAKAELKDNLEDENPFGKFSNLERLHDHIRYMNENVFSKYDVMTVGEVGGCATVDDALKYSEESRHELNMVFNFDHNWSNGAWGASDPDELYLDLINLKQIFNKWQLGLYGKCWNAIYWLNHDHPRIISHYGDTKKYFKESGKMLATALYFMWGTPFIYNGEEIGMTNPDYKSINDFKDVSTINSYNSQKDEPGFSEEKFIRKTTIMCRDNARTIMQWSSEKYAGFSDVKPWNIITSNYVDINVEKEEKDSDSILNYYKKVIALRLHSQYKDTIIYGKYKQILENDPNIYAYIRSMDNMAILVITNFRNFVVKIDELDYNIKSVVLSNYNRSKISYELEPFEAIVVEIDSEDLNES